MERQKKSHWLEFLEDPNNIWKANQYTKSDNTFQGIPTLRKHDRTAETDKEKATMLMQTFFPVPPPVVPPTDHVASKQWGPGQAGCPSTLPDITVSEMEVAINRSHPRKAAGPDGLTFQVWQRLLPVAKEWILWLYQTSAWLARLPRLWKTARIVTIRKPGKPDYTVAKAYRPISLLCTLSKGWKRIMATRLSHLAKGYQLLPPGHFGARPRRSREIARVYIVETIADAWRSGKVVSLATFDV
ncbi:Hypothetical protein D9617_74g064580 [Elsinoe fawcettii]|nr:Hypothetical protein D9617_74g064580 [Elsinoe fawcettii]